MESDKTNVAGAALLRSISAVYIFLPIPQEFRNIFLKEHLRKADEATCRKTTVLESQENNCVHRKKPVLESLLNEF